MKDRTDVVIHHRGWAGSRPIEEGEKSSVLLGVGVTINGHLIPGVLRTRLLGDHQSFATLMLSVAPSTIEHETHTAETWDSLWTNTIEELTLERTIHALADCIETIVWMSGSDDFAPGAEGHDEWVRRRELLYEAMGIAGVKA